MAMYMDVHPGLGDATADDIADAHKRDLAVQDKYGVRYLTYWFNDPAGKAFCLVEAPSAEAATACHKEAHGLMPHNIIEVAAPSMSLFLGDWQTDSQDRAVTARRPDTGMRAIMFTDIEGSTAMSTGMGDARALAAVRSHDLIVREALTRIGGREVKHTGDGILASFISVTGAVEATMSIQTDAKDHADLAIKIGLSVGEPVEDSDDIYGASVNLAARVCAHAAGGQTLATGTVRDMAIGKQIQFVDQGQMALKGFPEPVRLYEVRG